MVIKMGKVKKAALTQAVTDTQKDGSKKKCMLDYTK